MLYGIIGFGNKKALNYPKFLFSGSFNLMHDGHIAIADYIYSKYNVPVDFEISFNNVDKPSITKDDVYLRYKVMVEKRKPSFGKLYMTDDARYLEKARVLPDVTFVCGFDTIKALADASYYKEDKFDNVLQELNDLGIKWLVFPRHKEDGKLSTEEDFKYLPRLLLRNLKIATDFKAINISSSELRKQSYYRI